MRTLKVEEQRIRFLFCVSVSLVCGVDAAVAVSFFQPNVNLRIPFL